MKDSKKNLTSATRKKNIPGTKQPTAAYIAFESVAPKNIDLGVIGKIEYIGERDNLVSCTYKAEIPLETYGTISDMYDKIKTDNSNFKTVLKKYLYVNYVSMQSRINKAPKEQRRHIMNQHLHYLNILMSHNEVLKEILKRYHLTNMVSVHAHVRYLTLPPTNTSN